MVPAQPRMRSRGVRPSGTIRSWHLGDKTIRNTQNSIREDYFIQSLIANKYSISTCRNCSVTLSRVRLLWVVPGALPCHHIPNFLQRNESRGWAEAGFKRTNQQHLPVPQRRPWHRGTTHLLLGKDPGRFRSKYTSGGVWGGFWSNGRDGHKEKRRENDVNIKDQSRCGGRGGKREAAEPELAAELGIKALVYIINNESITN